jgi:predicted phosphodiesterase
LKLAKLPPSHYPRYDTPLRVIDDGPGVAIINDLHAPYHNAEFTNKVLELAYYWGIRKLVLGGDFSDQHSVSKFGAEFKASTKINGDAILEVMRNSRLTDRERAKFLNLMEQAGFIGLDDGLSGELASLRNVLLQFNNQFTDIYTVMGNHDDRSLRRIDKDLTPRDLLTFLLGGKAPQWHIEPFYYCEVMSGGEKYHIEHQHGTSINIAAQLAAKFGCHTICGHNHAWSVGRDISGRYFAINSGHCGDELRMFYAASRHNARPAHVPGAVIIRDGFPWVLNEWSPWDKLKKCK